VGQLGIMMSYQYNIIFDMKMNEKLGYWILHTPFENTLTFFVWVVGHYHKEQLHEAVVKGTTTAGNAFHQGPYTTRSDCTKQEPRIDLLHVILLIKK
jgi:hypothetical protein